MSIELHPRYRAVKRAELDLEGRLLELVNQHDLSCTEVVRILLNIASSWNASALRLERHGTTGKKADEA
jgi:hypothetical protein